MNIEPFAGPIGAQVTGLDLSQDLDASQREALTEAWNTRSVLVFRDQRVTPDEFLRFSRYFGELEIHVLEQYLHPDHPEILVVSNILDGERNVGIPNAGRYWHTDLSYLAEPSRGSILYAIEIPEADGKTLGNTLWASTAAAYEALPPETRKRIDGLRAEYSLGNRFNKLVEEEIACFAPPLSIRRYANSAAVTMQSVEDARLLTSSNDLLVDGRKWKV